MSETKQTVLSTGKLSSSELQFVSFFIDEHMYGIDINIVKEVNPNTDIAVVPRCDSKIRGMVNIRGQIVLVIDIAIIFGDRPRPVTGESQLIILKTSQEVRENRNYKAPFDLNRLGNKPVAFLVDRIGDVISVKSSAIVPAPPHIMQNKEGVARINGDLLVILNTGDLLAS